MDSNFYPKIIDSYIARLDSARADLATKYTYVYTKTNFKNPVKKEPDTAFWPIPDLVVANYRPKY